ncbi:hypothetical protein [Tranquillimonas alkanivorans]|uniref:Glycine zipper n=1 Tax=Tranquillimonas alkanivorans TaxID=441119 RepID=A0A1I5N525_9RHOB|nr:hypothetical protein [Tranquillimonas alkanivorans]SFP17025.1 hypothetical protein SAMN04488047_103107 [Tranquillimonas alkanivorans]
MGKTLIIGSIALLGLASCGQTDLSRGASGAGIGAFAAAATDNDPVLGALAGGAAGAMCDDVAPQLCPNYRGY